MENWCSNPRKKAPIKNARLHPIPISIDANFSKGLRRQALDAENVALFTLSSAGSFIVLHLRGSCIFLTSYRSIFCVCLFVVGYFLSKFLLVASISPSQRLSPFSTLRETRCVTNKYLPKTLAASSLAAMALHYCLFLFDVLLLSVNRVCVFSCPYLCFACLLPPLCVCMCLHAYLITVH